MGLLDFTDEVHQLADGKIKLPKGKNRPLRIQVYKNEFLEKYFAQAHPITPGIWFGWIVAYGLYVAFTAFPWYLGLLAFLGGVTITTLIEYFLHRFGFHFVPKSQSGRLNHFILHGYHHEFPNDPMRLVLPPIGIWPVGTRNRMSENALAPDSAVRVETAIEARSDSTGAPSSWW